MSRERARARGTRGVKRAGSVPAHESPLSPGTTPARDAAGPSEGAGDAGGSPIVAIPAATLALGFYFWAMGAPAPMMNTERHIQDLGLFPGLPAALGYGLVAAALLWIAMSAIASLRSRRGAVTLAAAGLYLSAGLPAIGGTAIVVAPVAVAAELGWIEIRKPRVLSGSFLLMLHAGAFVSALGFYHDWTRYADGWSSFMSNLSALGTLLL